MLVSGLERNKEIAVTRRRATVRAYKRLYGLARTRIMGLNKNNFLVALFCMLIETINKLTKLLAFSITETGQ